MKEEEDLIHPASGDTAGAKRILRSGYQYCSSEGIFRTGRKRPWI
jgi:hypothetical protein